MGSPYTNTKRKRGTSRRLQKSSKIALLLGAILLTCATVYTAFISLRSPDNSGTETRFPYGTIQELSSLRAFMPAYLSVNSSETILDNTRSIRIAGEVMHGGISENFVLFKMRPDRMLFTLKRDRYEITYGVIGPKVWRRVRAPQQEDTLSLIEGKEVDTWHAQAQFFDRIIESHLGNGLITGIESADWLGNECLKVHITDAHDQEVAIFIDPFSMHPIAERKKLANGSTQQTEFFDYHDVDGIPIPFHIIASIDNKVTTHTRIERAALNTGIVSRLFEVPDSLR